MAFNLAAFKTRTLTAAIFVIVMLAGILWNAPSFFVLVTIIHFGCWVEYVRLVGLIDNGYTHITLFHRYGIMIAGWYIVLYFAREALGVRYLNNISWWMPPLLMLILLVLELIISKTKRPKNIAHSLFGLVYVSLSWGLFMNLYNHTFYLSNAGVEAAKEPFAIMHFERPWILPAVIIACMWINDTMAYIVGSFIGKTPFSAISPKKTWEGTIGGIILCVALAGSILSFTGLEKYEVLIERIAPVHWYIIAAIAAIMGTLGDLLESKLKRLANVKDSGHIMPGHGGFLDRFDSILLATPFVWIYVNVFL